MARVEVQRLDNGQIKIRFGQGVLRIEHLEEAEAMELHNNLGKLFYCLDCFCYERGIDDERENGAGGEY